MSRKILKIIQVDDDKIELEFVRQELDHSNFEFEIESISDPGIYLRNLKTGKSVDAVILDLQFDGHKIDGFRLIEETKKYWPQTAILVRSNEHQAVRKALGSGCDDFITKTSFEGELGMRLFNTYQLVFERRGLKQGGHISDDVVGGTMKGFHRRVEKILTSAIRSVHIFGESGTGKEVIASIFRSLNGNNPFVTVNCGAISENLFESELFGSIKGAYTGSVKDTTGLVEQASGGIIYLDEIATLPKSCQAQLLRVVENQEIKRVGESNTRKIDVKIITATNENLTKLVEEGSFRKDLHQRLMEAHFEIPPLSQRIEEIDEFTAYFCENMEGGPYKITGSTLELFRQYSWNDGNVRELRNCLRAMSENHFNNILTPVSIPEYMWTKFEESPENIESEAAEKIIGEKTIRLSWEGQDFPNFNSLSDTLLIELSKKVAKHSQRLSLRKLAAIIGVPRVRLSKQFREFVDRGLMTQKEVTELVGLDSKSII